MAMEWQDVESSNLAAVGYDDEEEELQVRFRDGSTYSYSQVPQETYDDLFSGSTTVGKAFNAIIKGRYQGTKL